MGHAYPQSTGFHSLWNGSRCRLSFRDRERSHECQPLDLDRTLEYRSAADIVRLLPSGLLLIFLGLLIFALADPAPLGTMIAVAFSWRSGVLWSGLRSGGASITASRVHALADGIDYRIPPFKALTIPWQRNPRRRHHRRRGEVLVPGPLIRIHAIPDPTRS